MSEIETYTKNPDHFFFIHGLREALGKPHTADPRTPKEVWEEALEMVREGRRFDDVWTAQRREDYAEGYEFERLDFDAIYDRYYRMTKETGLSYDELKQVVLGGTDT